jgi:hypothetical protein
MKEESTELVEAIICDSPVKKPTRGRKRKESIICRNFDGPSTSTSSNLIIRQAVPSALKRPRKELPTAIKLDDKVCLYAYKDCLGNYNSLVRNSEMPLWLREGELLLQKLRRASYDERGLIYESTRIYSCWIDNADWKYLAINATVIGPSKVSPTEYPTQFLIHNVNEIEKQCVEGNFKLLKLTPYKSNSHEDANNSDKSFINNTQDDAEEATEEENEVNNNNNNETSFY